MKILLILMVSILFTSCGFKSVDNGNVAVVIDYFSKNVHDEVQTSGLTLKPFTEFVEVDATDIRLELVDLQPKDKKGMKFEDVDLTITVRLKRDKAVKLYKETKEVNSVDHNESNVLGYDKMKQLAMSVVTKAFLNFEYQDFMNSRESLDAKIKELMVEAVEKVMYGAYEIKDVKTIKTNLMPAIEKSFQNRSLVAQKELLVASKERLMIKEMALKEKEMMRLHEIAKKVGVTIKELMDYQVQLERNEVLSDMSKGNGSKVLLQVDK